MNVPSRPGFRHADIGTISPIWTDNAQFDVTLEAQKPIKSISCLTYMYYRNCPFLKTNYQYSREIHHLWAVLRWVNAGHMYSCVCACGSDRMHDAFIYSKAEAWPHLPIVASLMEGLTCSTTELDSSGETQLHLLLSFPKMLRRTILSDKQKG